MVDFFSFRPPQEELTAIRKALYRSDGPGFVVFRRYINAEYVRHICTFWLHEAPISTSHELLTVIDKKKCFHPTCPNYLYKTRFGHAYYNYFWNKPVDEATHAVSFAIQQLRNIVESINNYEDFFPFGGHSCSYRVVFTKNGDQIVEPHTDWTSAGTFRPEHLQCTLILSKKGIDYEGEGMKLQSNDKQATYVFDSENMPLDPGDLVLWRYNNLHSVENVRSCDGQPGFVRMIFPTEFMYPTPG